MINVSGISKTSIFFTFWVISLYAIAIPTWTDGELIYTIGALSFGGFLLLKNVESYRMTVLPVNYVLFLL